MGAPARNRTEEKSELFDFQAGGLCRRAIEIPLEVNDLGEFLRVRATPPGY
jgi:hypothetical protein